MISHPPDVTYEQGATGNSIAWVPTGSSLGTTNLTITRNGTVISSGTWTSGSSISVAIDGLAAGAYKFTIVVHDGLGGSASDSVLVTVTSSGGGNVGTNAGGLVVGTITITIIAAAVACGIVQIYFLDKKGME